MTKILVRRLMMACLAAAALCLCTTSTFAETPGKHPAYLHARSDLAKARQLMRQPGEEGNVAAQLRAAIGEVNQAIGEIDREEDNPAARAWRNRANGEINEAVQFVKKALLLDEADDVPVR